MLWIIVELKLFEGLPKFFENWTLMTETKKSGKTSFWQAWKKLEWFLPRMRLMWFLWFLCRFELTNIQSLVTLLDKDGDGAVNFNEFLIGIRVLIIITSNQFSHNFWREKWILEDRQFLTRLFSNLIKISMVW